jgi:hypothetical protein
MIDSFFTLTKGRAFWLAVAFVVVVLMHAGVSAMTGYIEPIGLLAALAIPLYFVVSLVYTLTKRVLHH